MAMRSGTTPSTGALVVTRDGKELGRVKEILNNCFKVDAPMQPDYWLGFDTIQNMDEGPVLLTLDAQDLNGAKMQGPGHAGYHQHIK